MTPRRAITPPDCRASLRAVKPLRFAPTPFGAGGLDGPSGSPRTVRRVLGPRRVSPVVYFDREHSQRYTVLEIVAENGLGLLHRISRVISAHGCGVDLVLISTEGNKAIDVFHLPKAAAKLSEAAEVLTRFPVAIQLRFMQTMREIASERSTTTFFPIPIELFGPLLNAMNAPRPPSG